MHFLVLILALFLTTSCTVNSVSEAFDDSRNESLAKKRIKNVNPGLADANINVTSFDGIVLLTGQVSSADLIPIASAQVEPLRNVRKVHNELTVAGKTTLLSRTNDSWLTTKVKSALSAAESSDATRIKVVTENSVVYLMGLLTRAEADAAVDIARDIQGVQKIVKVFEYIN
ncbi:MAG: BON domain-containing protein [Gammaproteobacteria bacterium]|jgi:osmotically-inducible protein OsmY|nr:BON domain-containing protein [Gammaproteobacteria bacterium]MDG1232746.1 BON domain-containing protein [Pseudomonadales bacterium]MBT5154146.1 BON domain-containing protein [Gammaproteobacteria bacterium]MBT5684844.1 BON domain-containing protein [Gammaproteobacteria bacterium]MBT5723142.1 BON domain-containing protein [Gammaproteobacteria bacterium]